MKKLQNNFTTPEQSKRLLELGVPADSADCCAWINDKCDPFEIIPVGNIQKGGKPYTFSTYAASHNDVLCQDDITLFEWDNAVVLPCWSVGRLIEIMTISYKWDLLSCASFRIYVTDIIGNNLINQLINDLSLEISRGKIDFSKLEED